MINCQKSQKKLQQMEDKYHSIFENKVVGIYQTTLEGCYISANATLARIYGYDSSTEMIAALADIKNQLYVDSQRRDEFAEILREKGEVSEFESQIYRRDGTIIWISENAWVVCDRQENFLYYEGFVEDITRRKQTEAALQESEERQRLLIESIQDYALFMLDSDGYVVSWNRGAEHIYQYQSEQIIGRHFSTFYTQKDIKNYLPDQELKIAREQGKFAVEKICLRQNKTQFWANVITTALYDDHQKLRGFSQVTRNITESKQAIAIQTGLIATIQASEKKFRDLYESTQDAVFFINELGFMDCNFAALKLFGCTNKLELCGKQPWEFSPTKQSDKEDSSMIFKRYLEIALHRGISRFNWRYKRLDGSEFPAEVFLSSMKFDGRSGWQAVVLDISNRELKEKTLKQANEELEKRVERRTVELEEVVERLQKEISERQQVEAKLRLSEEKFSKAFSCSPNPISITTFEDGRFIEVNDGFLEIMGYCREEIIGFTAEDLKIWVYPEAKTEFRQNLQLQGIVKNQEYQFRVKSGEIRVWLLSAEIIDISHELCVLAVITDITERKCAEEALYESQRKLATLVSNLPGMAYRFRNDQHRSVEFVSEGCSSLTGYQVKEFFGSQKVSLSQLIHPEDRQRLRNAIGFALQENQHYQVVYRITTKNGAIKWVWEQGIGVFSESGELIALEGFLTDITESKNAEVALKQSQNELRHQKKKLENTLQELNEAETTLTNAEKMSSLGQLIAGIAHEIKNPITSVYGNIVHLNHYVQDMMNLLNLYQEYCTDPPENIKEEFEEIDLDFMREDLPKVISAMQIGAERIRDIVSSLRNFSRKDDVKKTLMSFHDGINGTLVILQNRLKGRGKKPEIKIYKKYGELPLVECYVGMINQVFMNLIGNAIDALEEGFDNSNCLDKTPTITIKTEATLEKVIVRIIDNGLGMNEEVKLHLFERFFTTKPAGKGTGLGLSISYQIVVEKHKGKLSCISSPGEGAEFVMEIPIVQPV
ncbi:MAG: PAS domain S-box protein [Okeania sp. SIO3B5]|uniref:PAS domain S-box protein n=1 Tax=Okeania sp. SIO3B5 TaxID=2607811 RepID=UPI0013FFBD23|nr:PAS domain S-box protein [Okeania sp. SIO3B5]NEO56740.1 PAS domain S-box protein [Okeania sp. SIO3B5]